MYCFCLYETQLFRGGGGVRVRETKREGKAGRKLDWFNQYNIGVWWYVLWQKTKQKVQGKEGLPEEVMPELWFEEWMEVNKTEKGSRKVTKQRFEQKFWGVGGRYSNKKNITEMSSFEEP